MQKKIKTFLAALLAVTMVLGTTMTAFAAETVKETVETVPGDATPIDVTISYEKGNNITNPNPDDPKDPGNKDDTQLDIYNIQIAYDNLDFSYEAASIKWNVTDLEYKITTNVKGSDTRNIIVTNRSNRAVIMTPKLVDPIEKPKEVEYVVSLTGGGDTSWTSSNAAAANGTGSKRLEWGKEANDNGTNKDTLTVSVPAIKLTSKEVTRTIDNEVATKVSLGFAKATD